MVPQQKGDIMDRSNGNDRWFRWLPAMLIVFIGAIYCFLSFNIPLLGDDLGFFNSFAAQNDCWYALPRAWYRHWIWNNGRFSDMLTPLWLNIIPLWLNAVINGAVTALMFFLILKFSGFRHRLTPFAAILLIFVITFTFRWDALWMEFITQYCYVFTSTFGLGALLLFLSGNPASGGWLRLLSVPLCFLAAAMHEAMGIPLACGLTIYLFIGKVWQKLSTTRRLMALAIIAGGVFPMTSPPAWNRLGMNLQPEPVWEIMLFSAGWLCILLIAITVRLIRDRQGIIRLIRTPWVIFVAAAIVSCAIMLSSQYGGRTGWFCQIFALIALAQLFTGDSGSDFTPRWQKIIGSFLAIIVVAHYCAVAVWQQRLANQSRDVISLYQKSDDGIVYYDYLDDTRLPWYLLRKTHGVPDDDDTYYRYRMSRHYGHGNPLIILPSAAKDLDWENLKDSVRFDRFVISPDSLGATYPDKIVEIFPRRMLRLSGAEYIQIPFSKSGNTYYLYAPVDRDRGEK